MKLIEFLDKWQRNPDELVRDFCKLHWPYLVEMHHVAAILNDKHLQFTLNINYIEKLGADNETDKLKLAQFFLQVKKAFLKQFFDNAARQKLRLDDQQITFLQKLYAEACDVLPQKKRKKYLQKLLMIYANYAKRLDPNYGAGNLFDNEMILGAWQKNIETSQSLSEIEKERCLSAFSQNLETSLDHCIQALQTNLDEEVEKVCRSPDSAKAIENLEKYLNSEEAISTIDKLSIQQFMLQVKKMLTQQALENSQSKQLTDEQIALMHRLYAEACVVMARDERKKYLQELLTIYAQHLDVDVDDPNVRLKIDLDNPKEPNNYHVLHQWRVGIERSKLSKADKANCYIDLISVLKPVRWESVAEVSDSLMYLMYKREQKILRPAEKEAPLDSDTAKFQKVILDFIRTPFYRDSSKIVTFCYLDNERVTFRLPDTFKEEEASSLVSEDKFQKIWLDTFKRYNFDEEVLFILQNEGSQSMFAGMVPTEVRRLADHQLNNEAFATEKSRENRVQPITIYSIDRPLEGKSKELRYNCTTNYYDESGLVLTLHSNSIITAAKEAGKVIGILESQPIQVHAYSWRAKYVHPTLYNRHSLQKKIAAIQSDPDLQSTPVRIKENIQAYRHAATYTLDKLSTYDFESLIERLDKELSTEAKQEYPSGILEAEALRIAKKYIENAVHERVASRFFVNVERNQALLDYYAKDIEDDEKRNIFVKYFNQIKNVHSVDDFHDQLIFGLAGLTEVNKDSLPADIKDAFSHSFLKRNAPSDFSTSKLHIEAVLTWYKERKPTYGVAHENILPRDIDDNVVKVYIAGIVRASLADFSKELNLNIKPNDLSETAISMAEIIFANVNEDIFDKLLKKGSGAVPHQPNRGEIEKAVKNILHESGFIKDKAFFNEKLTKYVLLDKVLDLPDFKNIPRFNKDAFSGITSLIKDVVWQQYAAKKASGDIFKYVADIFKDADAEMNNFQVSPDGEIQFSIQYETELNINRPDNFTKNQSELLKQIIAIAAFCPEIKAIVGSASDINKMFSNSSRNLTEMFDEFLIEKAKKVRQLQLTAQDSITSQAAEKFLSLIHLYHYSKKDAFYGSTLGVIEKLIEERNVIMTDFSKFWYDRLKFILGKLQIEAVDIVYYISELEVLLSEGRTFIATQNSLVSFDLTPKLNALQTVIDNLTKYCISLEVSTNPDVSVENEKEASKTAINSKTTLSRFLSNVTVEPRINRKNANEFLDYLLFYYGRHFKYKIDSPPNIKHDILQKIKKLNQTELNKHLMEYTRFYAGSSQLQDDFRLEMKNFYQIYKDTLDENVRQNDWDCQWATYKVKPQLFIDYFDKAPQLFYKELIRYLNDRNISLSAINKVRDALEDICDINEASENDKKAFNAKLPTILHILYAYQKKQAYYPSLFNEMNNDELKTHLRNVIDDNNIKGIPAPNETILQDKEDPQKGNVSFPLRLNSDEYSPLYYLLLELALTNNAGINPLVWHAWQKLNQERVKPNQLGKRGSGSNFWQRFADSMLIDDARSFERYLEFFASFSNTNRPQDSVVVNDDDVLKLIYDWKSQFIVGDDFKYFINWVHEKRREKDFEGNLQLYAKEKFGITALISTWNVTDINKVWNAIKDSKLDIDEKSKYLLYILEVLRHKLEDEQAKKEIITLMRDWLNAEFSEFYNRIKALNDIKSEITKDNLSWLYSVGSSSKNDELKSFLKDFVRSHLKEQAPPENWGENLLNQLSTIINTSLLSDDIKKKFIDFIEDKRKNLPVNRSRRDQSQAKTWHATMKPNLIFTDMVTKEKKRFTIRELESANNANFITQFLETNQISLNGERLQDKAKWPELVEKKANENSAINDSMKILLKKGAYPPYLLRQLDLLLHIQRLPLLDNDVSSSREEDTDIDLQIYVTAPDAIVCYYKKTVMQESEPGKKQGFYELSGSVTATVGQNGQFDVSWGNAELKAYSPKVKYEMPTFYNRAFMANELFSPNVGLSPVKCEAIEEALSYVIDRLPCNEFEKLVVYVKDEMVKLSHLPEVDADDKDYILGHAKESISNYLRQFISDVIVSEYCVDKKYNHQILNDYLKDLPEGEHKRRLLERGKYYLDKLSIAKFQEMIAIHAISFDDLDDSQKKDKLAKLSRDLADVNQKQVLEKYGIYYLHKLSNDDYNNLMSKICDAIKNTKNIDAVIKKFENKNFKHPHGVGSANYLREQVDQQYQDRVKGIINTMFSEKTFESQTDSQGRKTSRNIVENMMKALTKEIGNKLQLATIRDEAETIHSVQYYRLNDQYQPDDEYTNNLDKKPKAFWQLFTSDRVPTVFTPSEEQRSLLASIAELYLLHAETCKKRYKPNDGRIAYSSSMARQHTSERLLEFFKEQGIPKSNEEMFEKYLTEQEKQAQSLLFKSIGSKKSSSLSYVLANNILSEINQYRLGVQKKLYTERFGAVDALLKGSGGWIDFSDEWYKEVGDAVYSLKNKKDITDLSSLGKLEDLCRVGNEVIEKSNFISRYFLKKKLNELVQFVAQFKVYHIEKETLAIRAFLDRSVKKKSDSSSAQSNAVKLPAAAVVAVGAGAATQVVDSTSSSNLQIQSDETTKRKRFQKYARFFTGKAIAPDALDQALKDQAVNETLIKQLATETINARIKRSSARGRHRMP